jgi:serine protease Do
MKRYINSFSILLLVAFMLTSCGLSSLAPVLSSKALSPSNSSGPDSTAASLATEPARPLASLEVALEEIYNQVSPSVVNIQVTQKEEVSPLASPLLPGFPFFFDPQSPDSQSPQEQPQEFYRHGAGSGFVWDKQGYIVTNNHVVAGADKISVTFADGNSVPAQVVGTDPDSDLAVLKVDVSSDQLSPVKLADSGKVKVGQFAIAIGNPFGLQGTMTVGIVSALGRSLPATTTDAQGLGQGPTFTIPEIIQTDAPINPGNSGGVLVNDQGEVIGVTAAIQSPVRASAGIGFAIPADIVEKVVPALITNGRYEHSWLGLSGTSLVPELAQAMNLEPDQRGALVVTVTPGGPADKAGIQGSDRQVTIEDQQVPVGGDVITAIDGQSVNDFEDLVAYLVDHTEVDQKVTLTVLREGKEKDITVTLAARPNPEEQPGQTESMGVGQAWLGINGITLTPEIAQAIGLPADQQGVLIEQVEVDSPADQANLQGSYKPMVIGGRQLAVGGDIITAIDDQAVSGMEDLQTFIQTAQPGQELTLTLLRDGKQVQVSLTLSERP